MNEQKFVISSKEELEPFLVAVESLDELDSEGLVELRDRLTSMLDNGCDGFQLHCSVDDDGFEIKTKKNESSFADDAVATVALAMAKAAFKKVKKLELSSDRSYELLITAAMALAVKTAEDYGSLSHSEMELGEDGTMIGVLVERGSDTHLAIQAVRDNEGYETLRSEPKLKAVMH